MEVVAAQADVFGIGVEQGVRDVPNAGSLRRAVFCKFNVFDSEHMQFLI